MTNEIIFGSKSKKIIPFDVQREYIQYHDFISDQELPKNILLDEYEKLFSKNSSLQEKKKILYLLAHDGSFEAYKVLQKYCRRRDKQLKAWAELCRQECAGHLKTELSDQQEAIIVIGGAGGDGRRLRYYFVFSSAKTGTFSGVQKNLVKKSATIVDERLRGKTEKVKFDKSHVLLSVLLPMDVAAETYFQKMYDAINGKEEILRYHYYVNNARKPTLKNIEKYLQEVG